MSACRDSGTCEVAEVADQPVGVPSPARARPSVDEHPDRLDGVERACPRRARRSGRRRASPAARARSPSSELGASPSSGSGSRCSAVKFRWPAPQSGRRSSSSGRARVTTRIGRPRDQSSSRLDEVEQPGVGPLKVLEDEHHRARVGDPLEERAPGREQLLAPPAARSSSPSRARSRGSIQPRSSSSGTCSASVAASLRAGRRLVVGLGDAGAPRAPSRRAPRT